MSLVGVELETLVSEPDALTTRPPPCAFDQLFLDCVLLLGTLALLHKFSFLRIVLNEVFFERPQYFTICFL